MRFVRCLGLGRVLAITVVCAFAALAPSVATAAKTSAHRTHHVRRHLIHRATDVNRFGGLDCNGHSPVQLPAKSTLECTDIRGFSGIDNANTWGGRFYDNGHYIGHDEPDMTFLSNQPGSGDNVSWTFTLPTDPAAAPTVRNPGSDVTHMFELSVAPWISMAMCDPKSYPLNKCTPQSDANAPDPCTLAASPCPGGFTGGGGAFMEMQFYPPGFPPPNSGVGCNDQSWCAALNIDSLECTFGFATCNTACEEPVNWALISTNGVPAGPPNPQQQDLQTFTPNGHTLMMNPGDTITIQMGDAPVPGHPGVNAFKVVIDDLTTGQTGFMQASAANGFHNTSIVDCSGKPFNFQPEYNTAQRFNITPWAALQTDISTQFEIGHFEPCTKVTKSAPLPLSATFTDTQFETCHGPYENTAPGGDGSKKVEATDAPCYPAGDTHGALGTQPDTMTGCLEFPSGGDLDFDGTSYWPDWPTSATPGLFPASFVESLPTTSGSGYSQYMIQTDTALSEASCTPSGAGCAVPPPQAPGQFYPFWSQVGTGSGTSCTLEFGNVTSGAGVNDLGGDTQYGTDQEPTFGYHEFIGPVQPNACT
jgi:hypothetical protein